MRKFRLPIPDGSEKMLPQQPLWRLTHRRVLPTEGKGDVAIGNITVTEDRQKLVDFTDALQKCC